MAALPRMNRTAATEKASPIEPSEAPDWCSSSGAEQGDEGGRCAGNGDS